MAWHGLVRSYMAWRGVAQRGATWRGVERRGAVLPTIMRYDATWKNMTWQIRWRNDKIWRNDMIEYDVNWHNKRYRQKYNTVLGSARVKSCCADKIPRKASLAFFLRHKYITLCFWPSEVYHSWHSFSLEESCWAEERGTKKGVINVLFRVRNTLRYLSCRQKYNTVISPFLATQLWYRCVLGRWNMNRERPYL